MSRTRGGSRAAGLRCAALAGFALACAETGDDPATWFERADPAVFRGDPGPGRIPAFDAVAADMDLDGDTDLLISWHHVGALELLRNEAGGFVPVDTPESLVSGLSDNPGVSDLFAEAAEIESRVVASGVAGLTVWHDADRLGSWRFFWQDPDRRHPRFSLVLEASRGFAEIDGLEPGAMKKPSPRRLVIAGAKLSGPQRFRVKTQGTTGRLHLRVRGRKPGDAPPVFVGRLLSPVTGSAIELWKPDPHGIAWVDVEGSAHPELWITRGGLAGFLRPPLVGKRDRYYVHRGGAEPLYRLASPGAVPRDHRRGRQVEWVDVDLDGRLEVSITGKATPNGLLMRDPVTGVFGDAAERLGLAIPDAEVASWGDLNLAGLPALFFLATDSIQVALNRGPSRPFTRRPGAHLNLVLPTREAGAPSLFESASLRQADFDNDGRLDLWLLGYGPDRTNHLFVRRGEGFEDVSHAVGLDDVRGNVSTVLVDADNDSFLDAVSFGPDGAWLWRNRRGERFELTSLPTGTVPEPVRAAVAGDFDGDGRTDLVVVGHERHLLRNRGAHANGFVDVALRQREGEPVGALVRAVYGDGTATLQRYGSMRSSGFSQSLQPLHFGIPAGVALETLGVRWPGERVEERYEVGSPNRIVELVRGAGSAPSGPR